MTSKAKEIAKKHCLEFTRKGFPNVEFEDHYDAPEWMIDAMKEYALHIAEQVVEEEMGSFISNYTEDAKVRKQKTCRNILSRIKTLTEQ